MTPKTAIWILGFGLIAGFIGFRAARALPKKTGYRCTRWKRVKK